MSNRRKGFISRNNSKGYFNQPFHIRNEHDTRKIGGLVSDMIAGGGNFKNRGRYDSDTKRFDPVFRGRNNRKRGGRHRNQDNRPRPVTGRHDMPLWYKITVPFGKKLDKEKLFKSLTSCSQITFLPVNYQLNGQTAVFYVDNKADADALRQCNRRLTSPDGLKIAIHISTSPPPPTPLNEENLRKIEAVMGKNFEVETATLNLHSFHTNHELRGQGLYAPLCRQHVLQAVVKIITSNIPQIRSLILSGNRLMNLHGTSDLMADCKDLKALNLKNNVINSMNDLNALKGCDITEITLDGNALCNHYKDKESYISDVRSKFPKIIKLDGQDLPPPIVFDLGTTEALPKTKGSYFPSQELAANVLQFLETYFRFYDSGNRQPLMDAYHEEAVYSMQVSKEYGRPQDAKLLSEYLYNQGNRNLFKAKDAGSREKYLRQGKMAIVSQLCNLPRTEHFPNSITVDVSHLSTSLMMFTVSGLFREVGSSINVTKAFVRNFLVVPHENGILIVNEMHLITSPTPSQMKVLRAAMTSTTVAPTVSAPVGALMEDEMIDSVLVQPAAAVAPVGITSDDKKKQLIIEMVNFSRMNVPYSTKCLEEQNWDLKAAMQIFTDLNNVGSIPAEAFQLL